MQFDWSQPQRQPIAGLAIVFLNTFWEILKRLWPVVLIMLLGNKQGSVNKYEIFAVIVLAFTIISAVLNFIYFRFYIEEGKLIIKKGWFKKETKVIPLEKIQTVNIEQGPLHQLLNIVKLSIDTAGSQKAEAKIDAMHKSMAEALRLQLISEKQENVNEEIITPEFKEPIIRLTGKDLLKLSISANHLEAFFILLSFGVGLYENLKNIDNNFFSGIEDFLPDHAVYPILFLIISILLITILVSTARIFFRFYDFTVFKTAKGYQIKSGLTNVKERLIAFQKIQFVSWKANWIRKLMSLWMLEYHIAGGNEVKNNLKVQLPVTQDHFISLLAKDYYPLPDITDQISIRIHSSYAWRRLLVFGIIPSGIIIPVLWLAWGNYSLLFLFYPLLILVVSWCIQKKFRLWALEDVAYISKGIFGEEKILIQWHKLQSVQIKQSIFQRRKNLANLVIHTAGGNIYLHYIDVKAAQELTNYMLYKTEFSEKSWM